MIHQSWVKACPCDFPGGCYWYGGCRRGLGKLPQWVDDMLTDQQSSGKDQSTTDQNSTSKLTGGREMVETEDHDSKDEGENTSESHQSYVETTDELTTSNDADCQQKTQSDTSHAVLMEHCLL